MDNGFPNKLAELKAHLAKVILGKSEVLEELIIALLGGGHILMGDIPGVGKTTLAKEDVVREIPAQTPMGV